MDVEWHIGTKKGGKKLVQFNEGVQEKLFHHITKII